MYEIFLVTRGQILTDVVSIFLDVFWLYILAGQHA